MKKKVVVPKSFVKTKIGEVKKTKYEKSTCDVHAEMNNYEVVMLKLDKKTKRVRIGRFP